MPYYFIAAAAFAVIIFLLNVYIKWNVSGHKDIRHRQAEKSAQKNPSAVRCPVCGAFLIKGEDLISRIYRPMTVPDQLCTINGCPHCYPSVEAGLKRICPICHKEIPVKDGHLVARLFNKKDGKKHVVVTGCTECCRGRQ